MEISELAKLATPADMKLAAEIHKCHYTYVYKILQGERNNEEIAETLRVIIEEREKLKSKLMDLRQKETQA
jgi:hypothetical protein